MLCPVRCGVAYGNTPALVGGREFAISHRRYLAAVGRSLANEDRSRFAPAHFVEDMVEKGYFYHIQITASQARILVECMANAGFDFADQHVYKGLLEFVNVSGEIAPQPGRLIPHNGRVGTLRLGDDSTIVSFESADEITRFLAYIEDAGGHIQAEVLRMNLQRVLEYAKDPKYMAAFFSSGTGSAYPVGHEW